MSYCQVGGAYSEFNEKQKAYWSDLLGKLLTLKSKLNNEQCGDNAKKLIPPLTLRGTAAELDNEFWQEISQPIGQVSALMVDMEKFQKQLEEAQKQSAINKANSDKTKADPRRKTKNIGMLY